MAVLRGESGEEERDLVTWSTASSERLGFGDTSLQTNRS